MPQTLYLFYKLTVTEFSVMHFPRTKRLSASASTEREDKYPFRIAIQEKTNQNNKKPPISLHNSAQSRPFLLITGIHLRKTTKLSTAERQKNH